MGSFIVGILLEHLQGAVHDFKGNLTVDVGGNGHFFVFAQFVVILAVFLLSGGVLSFGFRTCRVAACFTCGILEFAFGVVCFCALSFRALGFGFGYLSFQLGDFGFFLSLLFLYLGLFILQGLQLGVVFYGLLQFGAVFGQSLLSFFHFGLRGFHFGLRSLHLVLSGIHLGLRSLHLGLRSLHFCLLLLQLRLGLLLFLSQLLLLGFKLLRLSF